MTRQSNVRSWKSGAAIALLAATFVSSGVGCAPNSGTKTSQASAGSVHPSSGSELPRSVGRAHYAGLDYAAFTGGVDPNQPVGLMVYLDGDHYDDDNEVISNDPGSPEAQGMARIAAKKNMVLVIPRHPRSACSNELGCTWWEHSGSNAKHLKKLIAHLRKTYSVSPTKTWYMGYSGGAEFISYELARTGDTAYGRGGAILLAGGGGLDDDGTPITIDKPTDAFRHDFDLHWFVGSKDGTGQAENAPDFSALESSQQGQQVYSDAGFRTSRTVLPGDDHESYDFASVMEQGLRAGGQ